MNPKSMPRERLLGHMDIDTREWADGVLTDAARKVVKEPADVHCWIICDGDVDPEVSPFVLLVLSASPVFGLLTALVVTCVRSGLSL
jgi:hypothetical protein